MNEKTKEEIAQDNLIPFNVWWFDYKPAIDRQSHLDYAAAGWNAALNHIAQKQILNSKVFVS